MIVAEIVFSICAAAASYFALISYLKKSNGDIGRQPKLTRTRNIYLASALIAEAVALAFAIGFYKDYSALHIFRNASLLAILLPLAAVDYRYKILPNRFVIAGFVMAALFIVLEFALSGASTGVDNLKDCFIGAVVMGLFFLLLAIVFKNSLGMGDVKTVAMIGLFEGLWGVVSVVFYSLIASFFVALFFLIAKKKGKHDTMAFGPCILAGALLAICLNGI